MSFTKENPFLASLKERTLLSKPGSTKQIYHVVLQISDTHLFSPGDAIGLWPSNDPLLVERILQALKCSGEEVIYAKREGTNFSLREFLEKKVNIYRVPPSLAKNSSFKEGDLLSFLQNHPPSLPLQEVCNLLAPSSLGSTR